MVCPRAKKCDLFGLALLIVDFYQYGNLQHSLTVLPRLMFCSIWQMLLFLCVSFVHSGKPHHVIGLDALI
jgi:hypothetical protein